MEVLLTLRLASELGDPELDLRVEVEPDDTIASLADALATHAVHRGLTPSTGRACLFWPGTLQPIDPAARVTDTGLLNGETVALAEEPPESWPPPPPPVGGHDPGLSLDLVAGPDAGRTVALGPGDLVVGRASFCTLAIDDLTLSRRHFVVRATPGSPVLVAPNPSATNGTYVGNLELTEPYELRPGEVISAGASAFEVRPAASHTRPTGHLGQIPFNRVPYRRHVVTPRVFEDLASPPEKQAPRKLSIVTALSPALSAVGFSLITGHYYYLAIAGLSPVLLIYRHLADRRGGRRGFVSATAEFQSRVEARAADVAAAIEGERSERLQATPDLATLSRQATHRLPRLWERNRLVDDFLQLRLGLGDVQSRVAAGMERRGDEELRTEALSRLEQHSVVSDAPVTVDLVDAGVLGLAGNRREVLATGSSLVIQAACLHSPEDLVIAAAVPEADADGLEWLKWLPHVRSTTSPLEGQHLAVGPEASRRLMVALLDVVSDRVREHGGRIWPRVLVLLHEAVDPDRVLLARLLDTASQVGIHVLWLGESEPQLPRQCRVVVTCPGGGRMGLVRHTDPALGDRPVTLDGAHPATALKIAKALAPLRDASTGNETTAIPRVVSVLDTIGLEAPTPEAVARRWREPRPYGLGFALGMAADGIFRLDLVEQGPHALIGGTSGSGKSELLQTLVVALAVEHPPDRLNFLFVDYKGGASSAEFRDLPHTVGYVTNLDGRLSLRALTSLRAELQRRMALMEGRAKDLSEMLHVAPDEAPPSLLIVVDEFATLVKEIPEFVAGMVDIAQRGRSLGIHLVLATQRPAGAVNDNILGNTNLRISLRVLDPSDSASVVGTRDAADIPVPLKGRAYARTGPHALVAFQCAWSGAPFTQAERLRTVGVKPLGLGGEDAHPPTPTTQTTAGGTVHRFPAQAETVTELEVLVSACAEAAQALQLPRPRRPWVEPLPEVVRLDSVLERIPHGDLRGDAGRLALLGVYDDPENQAQHVATVDLEASGGLLVFGTGGSGKTTLLRTVAAGMAQQGSPEEVQIYGLDFASRALDSIADLPHCGAVVPGDDPERVTRLLTLLAREINERRGLLASSRAETLGALRARAGTPVFPRTVLLLDGYSGFHSAFDGAGGYQWLEQLQQIVSSGRHVGVHCVLTTERRLGLPSALLAAISSRVALRMATSEDLVSLGVPAKVVKGAELPDGRGFLGGSTEVQVACVSEDPGGVAQAEALTALAAELTAPEPVRAPDLPTLPEVVELQEPADRPFTAPLGLVDLTLATAEVDLTRENLVVTGPPLSGKSSALATVAWGIRTASSPDLHMVALGGVASPLAPLDLWDDTAFSRAGHADLVARLSDRLADEEGVDAKVVMFVDSAEDVEGNDVLRPLEAIARRDALRLAVACEPGTLARSHSGWLSALRRNRSIVVLQPDSRNDVEAVAGVKPSLRPGQDFPPGRGIFVAKRQWALVQVGLHPATTVSGHPPTD